MLPEHASKPIFRFGPFDLRRDSGELLKHGLRVKLQPQPAQVLALLAANAGSLVSRERIRQEVWDKGTFVDFERGLNTAINKIREALNDSAEAPIYVETLPKVG